MKKRILAWILAGTIMLSNSASVVAIAGISETEQCISVDSEEQLLKLDVEADDEEDIQDFEAEDSDVEVEFYNDNLQDEVILENSESIDEDELQKKRLELMAVEEELATMDVAEEIICDYVNPHYSEIFTVADLSEQRRQIEKGFRKNAQGLISTLALDTSSYCKSKSEVSRQMRSEIKNRNTEFQIMAAFSAAEYDDVREYSSEVIGSALEHTGIADEGDYLAWQYKGYSMGASYYTTDDYYYVTYSYAFNYFTTLEQEKSVTTEVNRLLSQWNLSGKTDYQKVKVIYDYLCVNITYDYANLYDDTYLLKHSAYAALINHTAVCQGYAVLLYRFLLSVGIDCRCITGTANNGRHMWNIVRLNTKYYNADSTWDAGNSTYNYFLMPDFVFDSNHTRDDEFKTSSFQSDYPMATEAATDHSHTEVIDSGVEATCTTAGKTEGKHCSVCGEIIVAQTIISATGHQYEEKVTKEATGDEAGVRTYTCKNCQDTYIEEIPAIGHIYNDGEVTKAANCTENGERTYTCTDCGKTYTEVIPAVGHSYKDNTCQKCGRYQTLAKPVLSNVENVVTGVKITWRAVAGAKKYRVYRKTSGSNWGRIADCTLTSFTDTTAVSGTTYSYTVRCLSADGKQLISSYDSAGKTILYLKSVKPTTVNAATGAKISWGKVAGAAGYAVYRRAGTSGNYARIATINSGATVAYIDTKATSGVTYTYAVRAFSGTTMGSFTGVTLSYLATPIHTVANVTNGVQIKWNRISGAAGYTIYRKRGTGSYAALKTVTGTATTYIDSSAASGVNYTYAVRAFKASGTTKVMSSYTDKSIKYLKTITPVLKNVSTGIKISWTKVTGATGYIIYRKTGTLSYAKIATISRGSTITYTDKTVKKKKGKVFAYAVRAVSGTTMGSYIGKSITRK